MLFDGDDNDETNSDAVWVDVLLFRLANSRSFGFGSLRSSWISNMPHETKNQWEDGRMKRGSLEEANEDLPARTWTLFLREPCSSRSAYVLAVAHGHGNRQRGGRREARDQRGRPGYFWGGRDQTMADTLKMEERER